MEEPQKLLEEPQKLLEEFDVLLKSLSDSALPPPLNFNNDQCSMRVEVRYHNLSLPYIAICLLDSPSQAFLNPV